MRLVRLLPQLASRLGKDVLYEIAVAPTPGINFSTLKWSISTVGERTIRKEWSIICQLYIGLLGAGLLLKGYTQHPLLVKGKVWISRVCKRVPVWHPQAAMASNEPQVPQSDFLLELTSPQGSVDTSTRDRYTVQQGMCCVCVHRHTASKTVLGSIWTYTTIASIVRLCMWMWLKVSICVYV